MIWRWTRIVSVSALTAALWMSPAYAQGTKRGAPPPAATSGSRTPVGEYALLVILLALPIGLICRSSRRF